MSTCRYFALFAAAVLLGCVPAAGQTDLHDWRNLQQVAIGTELWVKTIHGSYIGAFQGATDQGLVIESTRRVFFVPIRRDYRFLRGEVREVRYSKRGLSELLGAAIGVGVGAELGAIADAQARDRVEEGHLLAVTLGLLGGAMGAAVGDKHQIVKGKPIYVAP